MTQRDLLVKVIEDYGIESEMGIKAQAMVDQLDKKNANSSKNKNSKRAVEYAELENKICEVLANVDIASNGEIAMELKTSTQKLTRRLESLVANGRVTVSEVKGKKYYCLVQ